VKDQVTVQTAAAERERSTMEEPNPKKRKRSTGLQMLINNTPIADTRRRRSNGNPAAAVTASNTSSVAFAHTPAVRGVHNKGSSEQTPESDLRPTRLAESASSGFRRRTPRSVTFRQQQERDATSPLNDEEEEDLVDNDSEDDEEYNSEDDDNIEDDKEESLLDEESDDTTGKIKQRPAIPPDNVLLPFQALCDSYNKFPCPGCRRKGHLQVKQYFKGSISDLVITCQRCQERVIIRSPFHKRNENEEAFDHRNPKATTSFSDYYINYSLVLMMQLLGVGPDGLGIIFGFLGLAASKGQYAKWKQIQNVVGIAEEEVAKAVMKDNLEEEIEAVKATAKEQFNEWYFRGGGSTKPTDERVQRMRTLLKMQGDRVGIGVSMDGAWQRRAIGLGSGNSHSGHNMAVGCHTGKIINLVVYSKSCITCNRYKKKNLPRPQHRCPKNFDRRQSSKSMEPKASVQHKLDIDRGESKAYIHTLLTDDDSTVRSNMIHSYSAVANRDYPGWNQDGGCGKGGTDWPYCVKVSKKGVTYKHYYSDKGKIPLDLPPIQTFLSDIGHRVKCIGKMVFKMKVRTENPNEIGLQRWECLKLKKQAGYFLKQPANQELPFDTFKKRVHCIYLHHFNDHSCCDVSWCKVLKSRRTEEPLQLTPAYLAKFRCRQRDAELFQRVKNGYAPYLTDTQLKMVYHKFSSNKNESLNRRVTAVAPKDRYFSGTKSLNDRICNVVVTDSVGYVQGFRRILHKIDNELILSPVIEEWCYRKDQTMTREDTHRKKPEVKQRRAEAINKEIREGKLADARSKRDGMDYGSGIALEEEHDLEGEAVAAADNAIDEATRSADTITRTENDRSFI
jgi:hypothetical protein